jgi:hypothetical protein
MTNRSSDGGSSSEHRVDTGRSPADAVNVERLGTPTVLAGTAGTPTAALAALVLTCSADERQLSHECSEGGELIDPIVNTYLRRRFGLITSLDVSSLAQLPQAPGWHAELAGRLLRVRDDAEVLYTGAIAVDLPLTWYRAAATRGRLVIMIGRRWARRGSPIPYLEQRRLAGGLVGANVRLTHSQPRAGSAHQ